MRFRSFEDLLVMSSQDMREVREARGRTRDIGSMAAPGWFCRLVAAPPTSDGGCV
jgi:hypothetical protein